ncbi:MAG: tyrosine--tRNA ligase [Flavobacteriaceae bacterium]|nr:tyrosine--tRNA ligase [Flavobacteriaceae bacterium]MDG1962862.1 tyrosine--tRNA ligase [Flavobacteriaceae bacterium]
MPKNFIQELQWRGLIHDVMPDTEEHLLSEMRSGYVGFDPTADSLHIGNLVPIMVLAHFQRCGHRPIALVGGATGMIGDPSGKSVERQFLDENILKHNQECVRKQLSHFLDFTSGSAHQAQMVNNYDWMKSMSFLDFIRDVGKHITVNYMMAKDSVKNRIGGQDSDGMSFTEFTYQLVQGYDFLHLFQHQGCTLQMGGSDQWGNITTGTELIRRIGHGKGFALTCPLITKSDGSKFGKSEGGNVWLDAQRTSPYKFYQYWLNTSDEDAQKYIKIFTFLDEDTIKSLTLEHQQSPHLRLLQKRLAQEVTITVHGEDQYQNALKASEILFGKSTSEDLLALDQETFLDVFDGVPQTEVSLEDLEQSIDIISALVEKSGFLKSNGEARRALKEQSISVNKSRVGDDYFLRTTDLISEQFILLQRGKKNYFILKFRS